jgi:deoxyribonuclease V
VWARDRGVDYKDLHSWDVTPAEAIEIQRGLRDRLRLDVEPPPFKTVAGIDVSYEKGSRDVYSGVVVLDCRTLEKLAEATAVVPVSFPYVPGLLSFRETPAVIEAWKKLEVRPDCVMCDAHGYSHPRRFGLACHIGLIFDLPTIGCAKSRLVGEHVAPAPEKGSTEYLLDAGEVIGAVVTTKDSTSPVYVSQGDQVTLPRAIETVLACCAHHRIPEPTRRAHLLVNEFRRTGKEQSLDTQGRLF